MRPTLIRSSPAAKAWGAAAAATAEAARNWRRVADMGHLGGGREHCRSYPTRGRLGTANRPLRNKMVTGSVGRRVRGHELHEIEAFSPLASKMVTPCPPTDHLPLA